jgi:hypothetical protein
VGLVVGCVVAGWVVGAFAVSLIVFSMSAAQMAKAIPIPTAAAIIIPSVEPFLLCMAFSLSSFAFLYDS